MSSKPIRIPALEKLASETIGDGKSPNIFFVTVNGVVQTVTRFHHAAYAEWREFANAGTISALEDRKNGCICSLDIDEAHPQHGKIRIDDFVRFILRRGV